MILHPKFRFQKILTSTAVIFGMSFVLCPASIASQRHEDRSTQRDESEQPPAPYPAIELEQERSEHAADQEMHQARLSESPNLPTQWLDRRLIDSNLAYIYASDSTSARATERLVRKIANQFEEATGRQASRILIIVTDVGDNPLVPDLDDMYRLTFRYSMPFLERRSDQDLQNRWKWMRQSRSVLYTHAFLLSRNDLTSSLGLNSDLPESISWAAAVQTKSLMSQALKELADQEENKMLDATKVEGVKRSGLGLLLGLKRYEWMSKMKAKRDSIIYAAFVASDHELPDEGKSQLISSYWSWAKSGPSWLRGRPPIDSKLVKKDH